MNHFIFILILLNLFCMGTWIYFIISDWKIFLKSIRNWELDNIPGMIVFAILVGTDLLTILHLLNTNL